MAASVALSTVTLACPVTPARVQATAVVPAARPVKVPGADPPLVTWATDGSAVVQMHAKVASRVLPSEK